MAAKKTSPKPTNPSSAKAHKAGADTLTLPLDELRARVAKVTALIEEATALLPGLLELTDAARKDSVGRFRKGEAQALLAVLDLADAKPALFESLADKDHGNDPASFETGLLRDRLERIALLQPLAEASDELIDGVQDTVLFLGETTKPVMLAAYEIAKPQAKHDPKIRSKMAPALDYYGKIAATGAATRRRNKQG